MKNIILAIISVTFLQSCAQTKAIKASKVFQTFTVTNAFSKSIDKPEVYFSVEVPESLKLNPAIPGKKSFAYAKIEKHDANNVMQQMVSFGYIETPEKDAVLEQKSIDFLYQLKDVLEGAGYIFEESELLIKKFDGKEYPIFQGIGELKKNLNPEFQGRYWIKAVIVPNPYGNTNIMFYMLARDDQNINHYQDFADKLEISMLWKTFKYLK